MTSIDINQSKIAKKIYGSIYFPEVYSRTTVFIHHFTLSHQNRVTEEKKLEDNPVPNNDSIKISNNLKRAL